MGTDVKRGGREDMTAMIVVEWNGIDAVERYGEK